MLFVSTLLGSSHKYSTITFSCNHRFIRECYQNRNQLASKWLPPLKRSQRSDTYAEVRSTASPNLVTRGVGVPPTSVLYPYVTKSSFFSCCQRFNDQLVSASGSKKEPRSGGQMSCPSGFFFSNEDRRIMHHCESWTSPLSCLASTKSWFVTSNHTMVGRFWFRVSYELQHSNLVYLLYYKPKWHKKANGW